MNRLRLTAHEFQVADLAAMGLAGKQIAAELRLSPTAVRSSLSRAMRKLGLRGCGQLPAFWRALEEPPRRVVRRGGIELLVYGSIIEITEAVDFTASERSVLFAVLAGHDNRQIAAQRNTSARTVANQVAVLFRKVGASSKAELAAKSLLGCRNAVGHRSIGAGPSIRSGKSCPENELTATR